MLNPGHDISRLEFRDDKNFKYVDSLGFLERGVIRHSNRVASTVHSNTTLSSGQYVVLSLCLVSLAAACVLDTILH